ncbi:hypothetical protein BOTBODRAFT_183642 [Botryobasidium botryosum FD-172 SS1]|uniref:tRNA-splicing endonuclease subunit Sen15 domain-containing protein n=1 Tax=Botryobasidium botryosum (strain FD-172 SS1) TaxID=930990 RepID=A0A067MYY0_BOTB1|nr:hypothetical protein BOTBODRAFT_183642 [Botryobasidium botryosum FD-172 SS1]
MENHPTYKDLAPICQKYPRAAGCFFQAYNDILFSQQWEDVQIIDVEATKRGVITGRKPNTEKSLTVVPCALAESLSTSWLRSIFDNLAPSPEEIYLAITSEDSSIVYYKISKGIVKPPI